MRQRGPVVDLLDVEHLEAGLLHHRIDRLEAEERLGHRRAVAAAVGVLEQVELEGPQAEVELLGERGVRVLDGRRELGQVLGDGLQQRRLALEVVGVVGGQHLDLVEPDRAASAPSPERSASSSPSPPQAARIATRSGDDGRTGP